MAVIAGNRHYCWNCGHFRPLPDGWYCRWCLDFFRRHGRMSRPDDQ